MRCAGVVRMRPVGTFGAPRAKGYRSATHLAGESWRAHESAALVAISCFHLAWTGLEADIVMHPSEIILVVVGDDEDYVHLTTRD